MTNTLQPTAVLNVVGLTKAHLGPNTPFLSSWASRCHVRPIKSVLPAVTTTAQSTYLTGKWPSEHGVVANGWYFRDECEVKLWRQSNKLVQAPKVWDIARQRDPSVTVANLFWWYAMYSTMDVTVTPRPQYHSDGLKLPDFYTQPAALRASLKDELGNFPLFNFWGPNTSIKSSQWIADAAMWVFEQYAPTLTLVYLPHLDYNLQRHGEEHESVQQDLREIDGVCEQLIRYFEDQGVEVMVLSEYGITNVSRPIHINRALREAGLLSIREESGWELLDAGTSAAFAMADHQIAHIYINDRSRYDQVRAIVEGLEGVETVLDRQGQAQHHLDHERSGELVAIADRDSWFTYYYWLDDAVAPDFARCVDIHRKPGYDPAEMLLDPGIFMLKARVALSLAKKLMGFRYRIKTVPLSGSGIRGSHGRPADDPDRGAMMISRHNTVTSFEPTDICGRILASMFHE